MQTAPNRLCTIRQRVAAATTSLLLSSEDYQERFLADLYHACSVDGDVGLRPDSRLTEVFDGSCVITIWISIAGSPSALAERAADGIGDPGAELATIAEQVKRAIERSQTASTSLLL